MQLYEDFKFAYRIFFIIASAICNCKLKTRNICKHPGIGQNNYSSLIKRDLKHENKEMNSVILGFLMLSSN